MTIKASNLGHVDGHRQKNAAARLRQYQVSPGRYEIGDYTIWRPSAHKAGSSTRWLIDFKGARIGQRADLEGADQRRLEHMASQPETVELPDACS